MPVGGDPLGLPRGLLEREAQPLREVRAGSGRGGGRRPGASVTVKFAGLSGSTKASAEGLWMVRLGPLPAGGPHDLSVEGPENVVVHDLLVGDVWLCSGQSNMVWRLDMAHSPYPASQMKFPDIRLIGDLYQGWGIPAALDGGRWGSEGKRDRQDPGGGSGRGPTSGRIRDRG